jgi:hypothetical protein
MKLLILLTIIAITISSCLSSVPLVVNSPAAANSNVVTHKNQLATSAMYTTNTKVQGENNARSNATQADIKYALTKNIFLEAQAFTQKESSNRNSFSASRFPDTLMSQKRYANKGYNIGAGYFTKITNSKNFYFSIGAGYEQYATTTNTVDVFNNIITNGFINFMQHNVYVNPSVIYKIKEVSVVCGLQQRFINYNNVQSNYQSSNVAFVDSLQMITSRINYSAQLYSTILISPIKVPVAFKLQTTINVMQLPSNLRSRVLGISLGIAYAPFAH